MSFSVKGWCPGAYRPMLSGDGLVVRVRPRLARLTAAQALGLCAAALRYGAGLVDLTNRANIQIRGVAEDAWPRLIDALGDLGVLDENPATEARRNIVVAPLWAEGDTTQRLARELMARLPGLPELPSKMGFAVDAGAQVMLREVSADFRFERGRGGEVILRAEGREFGVPVEAGAEIDALIRLAEWFVASGGVGAGRMARHEAPLPEWAQGTVAPVEVAADMHPGPQAIGAVHGFAFGQARAADLARAITDSGAVALRVTPWRLAVLEGGAPGAHSGLLWAADAPELRVDACAGAPFCPQASVETRDLAHRLAPFVPGRLHVSGCAKGCARAARADVVLTGTDGRFDLAYDAHAGDAPAQRDLTFAQVLTHFGAA